MAIELPRAGPGSVGTGGRRRGTRLPDAGDVPQVRVAGDPGLKVPDFAQFAGGLGDIGEAAFNIGQRIKGRQEGIARDRDDTAFTEELSNTFRELQANADLADDRVIAGAMERIEAEEQRILNDHAGGSGSRALLEAQLARRRVQFGDQLAAENIAASRAQRSASMDRRVAGIVADALRDPRVSIEQRFGQLEDAIEFLDLSPSEARGARTGGEERIASALIDRVISRGEIDENGLLIDAREMLENDELREVLSPAVRGGFVGRIINIETTVRKVGLDLRAQVTALGGLADDFGIPEADKQDFILGMMSGGKVSDKRAALDRLVGKEVIDQDTSDKIAGGVFKMGQVRNEAGDLENVIVDFSKIEGEGGVTPIGAGETPTAAPIGGEAPTAQTAAPTPAEPSPKPIPGQIPTPGAPVEEPPQEQSIFDIVAGPIAVTGIGPEITEKLQGVVGQFGGSVASAEQLILRRRLDNAQRDLAVALVPNARFPQAQVKFVLEKTKLETGAFIDRRSLLSAAVALDETLRQQQRQAEDDSADPKLPIELRQSQAQNAAGFRNFRAVLGVPAGVTPADVEALGEPERGGAKEAVGAVTGFVKEVFGEGETTKKEVPPVAEIKKMTEEAVRALLEGLSPDTPISQEQVNAIKKKLEVK